MDWTPMSFYGDTIVVPGNSTAYAILYPLPDYSIGPQEFLVEDEDETGLFLERVVGEVYMSYTGDTPAVGAWQLMPLGVDYETPAVLRPYTTDWVPSNSEWANLRRWERRVYRPDQVQFRPTSVDIPYWTHVDFQPRQMMGAKKNQWPVLAMAALGVTDVRVTHELRAIWK